MNRTTLLLLFLLPLMQVMAISDQEVLQNAITLSQQGLSEQDIAKQLIQNGATIEQLQRLSKQVSSMRQSQSKRSTASSTSSATTQRTDNGETAPDWTMQPETQSQNQVAKAPTAPAPNNAIPLDNVFGSTNLRPNAVIVQKRNRMQKALAKADKAFTHIAT